MALAVFAAFITYVLYRNGKLKLVPALFIPVTVFYLSFVLTITVVERVSMPMAKYQLMPFWSYKAVFDGQTKLIEEVFWNYVLFIPVGILFSLVLPFRRKWLNIIPAFVLSAIIELSQLLLHRGLFEFDDIIHNTLGAAIGVLIYILAVKLIRKPYLKQFY